MGSQQPQDSGQQQSQEVQRLHKENAAEYSHAQDRREAQSQRDDVHHGYGPDNRGGGRQ